MCTLALAWQAFPDFPIAVAANRDEAHDRPSEPPRLRESDAGPDVIAPRDTKAGGTWIGVNESSLFVGITNRWTDADLGGERSRGLLVQDALREPSAEDACVLIKDEVDETEYAGFNLVLADERAAFLLEWDGQLRVRHLDPGIHVVVNAGTTENGNGGKQHRHEELQIPSDRAEAGAEQLANARRLRAALTPEPGEAADTWLDRAGDILGDHEYGVCVHRDGFGTRSSSLVRLDAAAEDVHYEFADGPPCETAYRPVESHF